MSSVDNAVSVISVQKVYIDTHYQYIENSC